MATNHHLPRLDLLPTEILYIVLDFLPSQATTRFSCVCRLFREISLPLVFRSVAFEFSRDSFDALQRLIYSEFRFHVVRFVYRAPVLLNPEILEFEKFKDILPPNRYEGAGAVFYRKLSYTELYDSARALCEEQRIITSSGVDFRGLSAALSRLPRLANLSIEMDDTIEKARHLQDILMFEAIADDASIMHHIHVVSSAVQTAAKHGISLKRIELNNRMVLGHTCYRPQGYLDLSMISGNLQKLVERAEDLSFYGCGCFIRTLSGSTLSIQHLDMSDLTIHPEIMKEFLETNRSTIHSIGCRGIELDEAEEWGVEAFDPLSLETLRAIVHPRQADLREHICHEYPWGRRKWILVFDCQDQVNTQSIPARKRKLEETL